MATFAVEPGKVKTGTCSECGNATGMIVGFAYRDGDAHGVYYLDWCEGHGADDPLGYLTIAVGDWDDEAAPEQRQSFGVHVRSDGVQLADYPHRDRPDFLGPFVPRDQAVHLDLTGMLDLARQIMRSDPNAAAVARWLDDPSRSALSTLDAEPVDESPA